MPRCQRGAIISAIPPRSHASAPEETEGFRCWRRFFEDILELNRLIDIRERERSCQPEPSSIPE